MNVLKITAFAIASLSIGGLLGGTAVKAQPTVVFGSRDISVNGGQGVPLYSEYRNGKPGQGWIAVGTGMALTGAGVGLIAPPVGVGLAIIGGGVTMYGNTLKESAPSATGAPMGSSTSMPFGPMGNGVGSVSGMSGGGYVYQVKQVLTK